MPCWQAGRAQRAWPACYCESLNSNIDDYLLTVANPYAPVWCDVASAVVELGQVPCSSLSYSSRFGQTARFGGRGVEVDVVSDSRTQQCQTNYRRDCITSNCCLRSTWIFLRQENTRLVAQLRLSLRLWEQAGKAWLHLRPSVRVRVVQGHVGKGANLKHTMPMT